MGTATLTLYNRETGQARELRANYQDHAADGQIDDTERTSAEAALRTSIGALHNSDSYIPDGAQIRFSGEERVPRAGGIYTSRHALQNIRRGVHESWRNSIVQLLSPTAEISRRIMNIDPTTISGLDDTTRINRLMRWAHQARVIANPGDPTRNPGLYEMIIGSDNPNDIALIGLIRNDILTQWFGPNGYTQQTIFNAEGQIDPGLVRDIREFLARINPFPPPAAARNRRNSPEENFRSRLEWEFVKYLVEPLQNINNPGFVSANARTLGAVEGTSGPGFAYRTELSPTEFNLLGAEMTRAQRWHTPRMRAFNATQVAALITIVRYFQYATGRLDPTY